MDILFHAILILLLFIGKVYILLFKKVKCKIQRISEIIIYSILYIPFSINPNNQILYVLQVVFTFFSCRIISYRIFGTRNWTTSTFFSLVIRSCAIRGKAIITI